jgi:hypothetical protein
VGCSEIEHTVRKDSVKFQVINYFEESGLDDVLLCFFYDERPALCAAFTTGGLPSRNRTESTQPLRTMSSSSNAFVDGLAELAIADWLDIGCRMQDDDVFAVERHAARARLEAALESGRLALAAWHVRDAVETVAYLACDGARCLSPTSQRHLALARAAAEDAALTMLVGDELSCEDRGILCAAFNPAERSRRDRSPAPIA